MLMLVGGHLVQVLFSAQQQCVRPLQLHDCLAEVLFFSKFVLSSHSLVSGASCCRAAGLCWSLAAACPRRSSHGSKPVQLDRGSNRHWRNSLTDADLLMLIGSCLVQVLLPSSSV